MGPGESSDYRAEDIQFDTLDDAHFTVVTSAGEREEIRLRVPGAHNVDNALAAVAAARFLGAGWDAVRAGLWHYEGTERRFQKKGEFNGVTVVDDYAHHPDEIRATLLAARKLDQKKIWCVFQPHTYTRTKALLKEFARALALADEVVLAKIYPARETDDLGISSADLAAELEALGKKAHYFETFDEIENFLLEKLVPGELLITMGAGDVVKIGENLLGLS